MSKKASKTPVAVVVAGKQVVATGTSQADLPELRRLAKQAGGKVYCAGKVRSNGGHRCVQRVPSSKRLGKLRHCGRLASKKVMGEYYCDTHRAQMMSALDEDVDRRNAIDDEWMTRHGY